MEGDKGGLALDGSGVPRGFTGLEVPDPWEWVALEGSLQDNFKEESQILVRWSFRRVSVKR